MRKVNGSHLLATLVFSPAPSVVIDTEGRVLKLAAIGVGP